MALRSSYAVPLRAVARRSPDALTALALALAATIPLAWMPGPASATPLFAPAVSYATGFYPNSVAVGDLNGDGKLDLVTANSYERTVSVLLGNGDGTFGAKTDRAVSQYAEFVALADLNHDGKLDLAVSGESPSNVVSVLLGNGDGSFGAPDDIVLGSFATSVAIADLDGDGNP